MSTHALSVKSISIRECEQCKFYLLDCQLICNVAYILFILSVFLDSISPRDRRTVHAVSGLFHGSPGAPKLPQSPSSSFLYRIQRNRFANTMSILCVYLCDKIIIICKTNFLREKSMKISTIDMTIDMTIFNDSKIDT